jgi:hypothetical protein
MTISWPKSSEGYERDSDDPEWDEILSEPHGATINPKKSKHYVSTGNNYGLVDVHYRNEGEDD